jgi:hypothetical protein
MLLPRCKELRLQWVEHLNGVAKRVMSNPVQCYTSPKRVSVFFGGGYGYRAGKESWFSGTS